MHTIELTSEEIQELVALIDAGVRATGLRAAKSAAMMLAKIEASAPKDGDERVAVQSP